MMSRNLGMSGHRLAPQNGAGQQLRIVGLKFKVDVGDGVGGRRRLWTAPLE
jgi:hypothetical protein